MLLVGDINKHIGDLIRNNHSYVSYGGKLLREFLESDNYVLANALNVAEGGPFTRYNPADPLNNSSKSCLDLIIVSKSLVEYIDQVVIDSKLAFTPGRATRNGMRYTDHYSLLLTIKNIPLKSKGGPKTKKM